ncbi:MAG: hypothetical protein QM638_07640, partial [Nocardioides sp.]|uniref:hypothetical protein n=1 Tax=Nocardioides sp. TaxID=35761 RepID=UPI0039E6DEC5
MSIEAPTTEAPRVVLHIGLAKTGTTFLQHTLRERRPELAAHRVAYPDLGPAGMFRAAVGVTGRHQRWGFTEKATRPLWSELCARARSHQGTTVMGHEVLSSAGADARRQIATDLADVDLSIVVTARDLARQIPAWWQERVKNQYTFSFTELVDQVIRPRRPGRRNGLFWRSQDLGAVLRRWSEVVPPERLHLVIAPPPGAPGHVLWDRFATAVGLPAGAVAPLDTARNPSLGTTEIALLRRVNEALDDRLPPRQHARVVKHFFAERILTGRSSRRAVTPAEFAEPLTRVTAEWVQQIQRDGHPVHGDLDELRPVCAPPDSPYPDQVDSAELVASANRAVADLLVEVARLRTELGQTHAQLRRAQRAAEAAQVVAAEAAEAPT